MTTPCPAWCTRHLSRVTPECVIGETHHHDVWALLNSAGDYRHWVDLDASTFTVRGEVLTTSPSISLTSAEQIGGVPCTVTPDQARALAAALLAAAAIVEASWTAACGRCGAATAPERLFRLDDVPEAMCFDCRSDALAPPPTDLSSRRAARRDAAVLR